MNNKQLTHQTFKQLNRLKLQHKLQEQKRKRCQVLRQHSRTLVSKKRKQLKQIQQQQCRNLPMLIQLKLKASILMLLKRITLKYCNHSMLKA